MRHVIEDNSTEFNGVCRDIIDAKKEFDDMEIGMNKMIQTRDK